MNDSHRSFTTVAPLTGASSARSVRELNSLSAAYIVIEYTLFTRRTAMANLRDLVRRRGYSKRLLRRVFRCIEVVSRRKEYCLPQRHTSTPGDKENASAQCITWEYIRREIPQYLTYRSR